jgi:translation elongation factor P/translation initiation factor 5A
MILRQQELCKPMRSSFLDFEKSNGGKNNRQRARTRTRDLRDVFGSSAIFRRASSMERLAVSSHVIQWQYDSVSVGEVCVGVT